MRLSPPRQGRRFSLNSADSLSVRDFLSTVNLCVAPVQLLSVFCREYFLEVCEWHVLTEMKKN